MVLCVFSHGGIDFKTILQIYSPPVMFTRIKIYLLLLLLRVKVTKAFLREIGLADNYFGQLLIIKYCPQNYFNRGGI